MKNSRLFGFILIVIALAFVSKDYCMAQSSSHMPFSALTTEWQLDREVNGIQIYAHRLECHDVMNGMFKEFVMLKFVNTTAQNVRLEWGMELWYDGECSTCGSIDTEYHYILDLDAGGNLEGSCEQQSPREVKLFLRFLNYDHIAKLTQYNMADLKVSPR